MLPEAVEELLDELEPKPTAEMVDAGTRATTAIEEMLRYEGPIQLNNRRLHRAAHAVGAHASRGRARHAGNRRRQPRPSAVPGAGALDVAREPNRHVAFGHGDRACAGMNVACMEARIAFARLLARFPRLELAGTPERDRRIRFRGFRRLPVST